MSKIPKIIVKNVKNYRQKCLKLMSKIPQNYHQKCLKLVSKIPKITYIMSEMPKTT
jgi:hypothetical protein